MRIDATEPAKKPEAKQQIEKEVGDLAAALQVADPAQRAQLYQELGISGLYEPASRMVIVTVDPWVRRRSVVSEGDMRLEATPLLAHVAALAA